MGGAASSAITSTTSDTAILAQIEQLTQNDPTRAARLLSKAASAASKQARAREAEAIAVALNGPHHKEIAVIKEMNSCRTNPRSYAAKVEERLQLFDSGGVRFQFPNSDTYFTTKEGVVAVKECVEFLRNASPVAPLSLLMPEGMRQAAEDHATDLGQSGTTGHEGSDGSTLTARLERYGQWKKKAGENLSYGHADAERIIIQLLIDDGVADRGHREVTMSSDFTVCGVSIGPHKIYGTMCTLDFAGGWGPKVERLREESRVETAEMSEDVRAILRSLPDGCEAVIGEVEEEIRKGEKVVLEYKPGGSGRSGSYKFELGRKILSGQWGGN